MIERQLDIPTREGAITTFITHPERDGPHPVILMYMDAPGVREELRDMARRLASAGYYVMLPNLYYRSGVMELPPLGGPDFETLRTQIFSLMDSLTIAGIMADTEALLAFATADDAASRGPVGTVGYCMSGQYALNAAAHFPRVAAAASFYGVKLVTDQPDSPHLVGEKSRAELYVAMAEIDEWAPLDMMAPLRKAFDDAGATAEVEFYPKVEHGFAFPERAGAYNQDAAERHWERLFALYRRRLG